MSQLITLPAFWCALLCAGLFAANVYVFLKREWEASHRGVDYAQLNYPLDAPTIRRWRIGRDLRLCPEIVWNRTPDQWQLLIDDQPGPTLPGGKPWIEPVGPAFDGAPGATLDHYRHRYVLRPLPAGSGPDVEFSLVTITRRFYGERGMHFPADLAQVRTRVPTGRFKRFPVRHWVDDYRYMGATRLAEADRIVREEMGITEADAPLARMEKVIRHMRATLVNGGGVPKDDFRWADPLRIYQEMRDGTGKGWCTQNAQIYTFFANRAGVATRFVFGSTVQSNQLVYNGHSWAESYLPDQGRWVYVDPQASIVAVFDRNGLPLNSADVFHLCIHETLEGATARIFKDWSWKDVSVEAAPGTAVDVPFALVSKVARQEFNQQTIIKYRRPPNVEDIRDVYSMLAKDPTFAWTNFKRYLFVPDPAYSFLPTDGRATYRLRRSLFAGLVLSIGALVIALI